MTKLVISAEDSPETSTLNTTDPAVIKSELLKRQVKFEQWTAQSAISADADSDAILNAYADDVDRLKSQGYDTIDVLKLAPEADNPDWPEKAKKARQGFLEEHTHADDEVRFFIAGKGCFYLRINGEVLMTVCEAGDLIWVPAGTTHWFDMGKNPELAVIRFFRIPEGWIGDFTGDKISAKFPTLDELVAA